MADSIIPSQEITEALSELTFGIVKLWNTRFRLSHLMPDS